MRSLSDRGCSFAGGFPPYPLTGARSCKSRSGRYSGLCSRSGTPPSFPLPSVSSFSFLFHRSFVPKKFLSVITVKGSFCRLRNQTYSIFSPASVPISCGSSIFSQSSKDFLEMRIMLPIRIVLNDPEFASL